jgi:phosphatidylserine decarboxylase
MRILRKLLMFCGLIFVAAGAILSLVGELIGFVTFSGSQNLLISSMGVVIFWLSLERVHPEGYKFFLIFILLSSLLVFFYLPLGILGFLITIFILWFFRDPDRMVPSSEVGIISPADGVICKIEKAFPPKEVKSSEELLKISVFMNVFNVHINRAPVAGNIKDIIYVPGKFINASLDKASEDNERNILVLENNKNEEIIVVQIAGLIARRILSFVNLFDSLKIGERFGLIRFGSRVDVYLPSNYDAKVELGQKVTAGETIIAS